MIIKTDKGALWDARYVVVIADKDMPEVVVETVNNARPLSVIAQEAESAEMLTCTENIAETRVYSVAGLRALNRNAADEGHVQLRFWAARAL